MREQCSVEGCTETVHTLVYSPAGASGYCWEHGPWKAAGETIEQHPPQEEDPVLKELAEQLVIARELAAKLRGAYDRALSLKADDLVPTILTALEGKPGRDAGGLIQLVELHETNLQLQIEVRRRNIEATREYLSGPVPNDPEKLKE